MVKQHAPGQQRSLTAPQADAPAINSNPLSGGNTGKQDRLRFITDIQGWLGSQQAMLESLSGTDRVQRIQGVLTVLADSTSAFQQGEDVDLSNLPTAPTAASAPVLGRLMPGLSSAAQPFLRALSSVSPEEAAPVQAGMFNMGGLANIFSTEVNNPEQASAEVIKVSTTGGRQTTAVQLLASQVMALKLKLPGEKGSFSLKKYGDRDSAVKILQHCVSVGIKSPDQVAYILATAWHESRLGKWMTESGWLSEKSAERYAEKKYGPNGSNPTRAKKNGNTKAGDGGRYMGRGYVQLTWKNNYKRMSGILKKSGYTYTQDGVKYGSGKNGTKPIDLVTNYKHVNRNKDLAARILVLGMDGGHYVGNGKGLDSYIPENKAATSANFQSARKIVNGSDKKKLIAGNAVTIAAVLRKKSAWSKAFSAKNTLV